MKKKVLRERRKLTMKDLSDIAKIIIENKKYAQPKQVKQRKKKEDK